MLSHSKNKVMALYLRVQFFLANHVDKKNCHIHRSQIFNTQFQIKLSENRFLRQIRQLSYLTQFDCDLKHIPGKQNITADCLSRVVIEQVINKVQIRFSAISFARSQ